MKKLFFTLLVCISILVAFICCSSSPATKQRVAVPAKVTGPGFVVMELFTSQGCSSCPPADELLGKYAKQGDEHILPLAFHVDYWNRLGWTDSLSSSKYTDRQNRYAELLQQESVYTPQLVLNGREQFVGSDAASIAHMVSKLVSEKPLATIDISSVEQKGRKVVINYAVNAGSASTVEVLAALVQNSVITHIRAGENKGVELTNYNVVRDLESTSKLQNTQLSVQLPAGADASGYAVVLFVQEEATGKIIAASRHTIQ